MKRLTEAELKAQAQYIAELSKSTLPTRSSPLLIAMVGGNGSGKSTTAQRVAEKHHALVVSGDRLRAFLRKQDASYDNTVRVGEGAIRALLEKGYSVVVDSDHAPENKRASLVSMAQNFGIKPKFVRTVADLDVVLGRIGIDEMGSDRLYMNASSAWTGERVPQVVRTRECVRRIPHHYTWEDGSHGGRWILKEMPFVDATVHTDAEDWESQIPDFYT